MTNPVAVFRTSASSAIGGGHIIRCLALADELAAHGWFCVIACGSQTPETIPSVGQNHPVFLIDEENQLNEPYSISEFLGGIADLMVIDHYHRGLAFETACRQFSNKIMVIEDLPNRRHDADVLLDQSGGRVAKEYLGLVPERCEFFIGPHYALLRQAFRREPSLLTGDASKKPFRVFVSMGATDETNLTGQVIQTINKNVKDVKIDVLISGNAPHIDQLKTFVDTSGEVSLHVDIADPVSIMANADLAVGAAGINLWERCALGIPSLIVINAENQIANAHHVADAGGGWIVGSDGVIDDTALSRALNTLPADRSKLKKMSIAARIICDGSGAKRVANCLEERMEGPRNSR